MCLQFLISLIRVWMTIKLCMKLLSVSHAEGAGKCGPSRGEGDKCSQRRPICVAALLSAIYVHAFFIRSFKIALQDSQPSNPDTLLLQNGFPLTSSTVAGREAVISVRDGAVAEGVGQPLRRGDRLEGGVLGGVPGEVALGQSGLADEGCVPDGALLCCQ